MKTASSPPSSETLIELSIPDADRNGLCIDREKIYPELIADLLMNDHKVKFRAPGYSMYPTILHEDVIIVEPVEPSAVKIGDIILYRVQDSLIAHRVVKIEIKNDSKSSVLGLPRRSHAHSVTKTGPQSYFILRGDARPACDDPVAAEQVLGKVVLIEINGRVIDPYSFKARLNFNVRRLVFRLKRFMNQV